MSSSSSMAEKEDMSVYDISALVAASVSLSSSPHSLSPEDVSWVDSCLAPVPELPPDDRQWAQIGEALLEAIAIPFDQEEEQQQQPGDNDGIGAHTDVTESNGNNFEVAPEEEEGDEEYHELMKQLKEKVAGSSQGENLHELRNDIFRPEEEDEDELVEQLKRIQIQIGSQEEIESHDNIFKVWDLQTPSEEEEEGDEFVKQFKEALANSSITGAPPPSVEGQGFVDVLVTAPSLQIRITRLFKFTRAWMSTIYLKEEGKRKQGVSLNRDLPCSSTSTQSQCHATPLQKCCTGIPDY